jgi:hypothetical protein
MKYEFKHDPWDHQRRALAESWNKPYWSLLFEYGCGKTKVVIDTAGINFEVTKEIDALLVIAPNNVHSQWINEQVPEHLPDRIPRIARIWTGSRSKKYERSLQEMWDAKNSDKLKIFSMNIEALQSSPRAKAVAVNFLKAFKTLLVVDESTRIKTPGAKRTKFVVNRLSNLAVMRRTLTGNEVTRSPFDVYAPYRFLDNGFWKNIKNYHVFQNRYAEFKQQRFYKKDVAVSGWRCPKCSDNPTKIKFERMSGRVFAACGSCSGIIQTDMLPYKAKRMAQSGGSQEFKKVIGYKHLDELVKITQTCSSLVRKSDCMDLPEKIYQPIYTEMNDEQKRVYSELKKSLYTEYEGAELEVVHKVALRTRFRQIVGGYFPETGEQIGTNNPKLDRVLYDLEDIDTNSPIIIWASFTAEIEGLYKRMCKEVDGNVVAFYGTTPKPERSRIIQEFKDGKIDYFIANPAVAGTGLNLQRAYINYYFSNTDRSEDRWQSEDRTHRGGQKNTCLYKDVYIKGTIDDVIKKSNEEKKDIAEYFKSNRIEDFLEEV